jgi:Tfp pilus assembly PilM family ATPase
MHTAFLFIFSLLVAAVCAHAAEPITNFNVVLLQPSAVMEKRVADIDAMADYIKAVEAASREAVIASGATQAVGGFIVLAVKPGQQSKVWLDFDALLDLEIRKQITKSITAIKPFAVTEGPVVFALKVATWDGKESKRVAPSPPEWKKVTRNGKTLEIGQLVEKVWRD